MCRLLGIRAETATAVRHALVSESNCLRIQSNGHKDGWGIAHYGASPQPEVVHGLNPAHLDPEFERVGHSLHTRTVVAHVRLASVGAVTLPNAHPFVLGRWSFAHNGNLTNFSKHREAIEQRIAPELRSRIRGDTDSERCFLLFLTALRGHERDVPLRDIAAAVAATMRQVVALTHEAGAEPSALNFMVSDGERLVASRRGRSLFHAQDEGPASARRVIIASERVCGGSHWQELPEDTLVGTDDGVTRSVWSLDSLMP